jgi:hypothetical protein
MNNKLIVGGIFCDVEKAFDCVNHNILLAKLKLNGIVGIMRFINHFWKIDTEEQHYITR